MKKKGYYSSGQFSTLAKVTLRTIRFYDKKGILKPTFINENGARFYTDMDLLKLQQILLLKYLGFTLKEIQSLIVAEADSDLLLNSLNIQKNFIKNRIEQMQMVEQAIEEASGVIQREKQVNWDQILRLIHLTKDEINLKKQYEDASNLSARIALHQKYSSNKQGWFPWIYEQIPFCQNANILEVGCGDGTFWKENLALIPQDSHILLSDLSAGMVRDARRQINHSQFSFQVFDCSNIPFMDNTFDIIIANHVLFYCDNIDKALKEINRVLKKEGIFICSTYGSEHMQEITELVQSFDKRINLSSDSLVQRFGKENGEDFLSKYFSDRKWLEYEDFLLIDDAEPLIAYILSCHGNQKEYILSNFKEFNQFVQSKTEKGIKISKKAGIFLCRK